MKTIGNSRPLAACIVIRVTYDDSGSSVSRSLTSAMLARKSSSVEPVSGFASNSLATPMSSCMFSTRARLRWCRRPAVRAGSPTLPSRRRAGRRSRTSCAFSRRSLISSAKRSSSRCFFGTARLSKRRSNTAWPTETPAAFAASSSDASVCWPMLTARNVDDAAERDRVRGVHDVAQVREHVLDLGARIETDAADDPVGDALGEHAFFEDARLRVRAVEHEEVAVGRAVANVLLDLLDDVADFGPLATRPGKR